MHRAILASSFTWVALILSLALGCAPSTGGPRRDSGGGAHDGGPITQHPDSGGARDAGRIPFEECAREVSMAETRLQPVDIVWIIDNSGSMSGEARIVQENMNSFAAAIGASGIDYHVVVMTMSGFVNVPAPLGTDTERFRFANVNVQSHDGLSALVANYSTYSDFLRPTGTMHFVVVTDDESENMSASEFQSQMSTLLGRSFTFHTIASPPGSMSCPPPPFPCFLPMEGCQGPEDNAAANGDEYYAVSSATGGLAQSICTNDWSSLFASLTAAIAIPTTLPCRYVLPTPPDGMELDRMKVNVLYTATGATTETIIPYVGNYTSCGASGGWYYEGDDVVVCPATCTTLTGDASGRVDIALGCETILF